MVRRASSAIPEPGGGDGFADDDYAPHSDYKMHTLKVPMNAAGLAKLHAAARRRNMSTAALVRRAIEELIRGEPEDHPPQRKAA